MYHQIFTSVKIASPMPARAGNFARTFRRTFRRRLWQQGPTRNGGGSSSLWESHSGLCRFSGTGFRKRLPARRKRRQETAACCLVHAPAPAMRRRRPRLDISKKNFSPRTDLDDRPRLGGKTPPSPGRRVPVDSPEDRRFSNRSKSHRRCRHAMDTSHGRSDGRSDAGYGRKNFSPRTDLDDRPRLGGKTPRSPGRRVPVDSPEDRRFSNRSKSHRRCRHAMETSHGRFDGRSDAGCGNRVRLGTVGEAPHCGSRTPDFAVFLVRDFAKDYRRDANAGRRPPLAVSCMRRHRLCDAGDRVSISRRKNFSPRTDLDDRPRLGGKTPPSPGRRVPVDSPEDRRFSNRSKSHRRCRHAMETSHGRSDGRSDAGYGGRVRLGTAGYAPTGFRKNRVNGGSNYDSRTCVYVSSDFHIGQNRVADAGTRRKLRTNVPSDVPAPAIDAPTGFRKNRVNGESNYDSRTCVYVSSDFYIFRNHVPDASIRWKLGM